MVSPHDEPVSDEWKTIKLEVDSDATGASGSDGKANALDSAFYGEKRVLYEGSTVFHRRTYVLAGLRCGTKYFVYVNAYNQVGQGDPSEVILSRTEGNGAFKFDFTLILLWLIFDIFYQFPLHLRLCRTFSRPTSHTSDSI